MTSRCILSLCPALMSSLNIIIWVYILVCVFLFLPRVCTVTEALYLLLFNNLSLLYIFKIVKLFRVKGKQSVFSDFWIPLYDTLTQKCISCLSINLLIYLVFIIISFSLPVTASKWWIPRLHFMRECVVLQSTKASLFATLRGKARSHTHTKLRKITPPHSHSIKQPTI